MDYDYLEVMKQDILEYINENYDEERFLERLEDDRDELEQELYDELWVSDSVTGNASGSYTFSTYDAEENICHNLDLLAEALAEFGSDGAEALEKGAEFCDVTIRCYLLGQALSEALDELEEKVPEYA